MNMQYMPHLVFLVFCPIFQKKERPDKCHTFPVFKEMPYLI